MIKVDLITGFLGAGKTTFLHKYASYLMKQGLRIGILEYDYGAVNVDMLLLNKLRGPKCELEMLAAACDSDCLKRRFKTKLISMAMSGYDRVIIEPSGVFDMDMFFDDLRDEPLENWYEIGSVIAIVNANLRDELNEEEDFVLASQVADAGCIVLSRTQFSDSEKIERTKHHIDRACRDIKCNNFKPKYIEKPWDDFTDEDMAEFTKAEYRINDYVKVTAGAESAFSSVCFLKIPWSLEELKEKIILLFEDKTYGNVKRVKGFVYDEGISHQINVTSYEFLDEPIAIGQDVLIVIGTELNEKKIKELLSV